MNSSLCFFHTVVTGSGHGIGRAYAEELAGYGLKIVIVSLGQTDCEVVARYIGTDDEENTSNSGVVNLL